MKVKACVLLRQALAGGGIDRNYLGIFAFGIISCVVLLANPGYYSHDELQKLDHIIQHGYLHYFQSFVEIKAGEHFGYPVRPFSFFIQGVQAYFLENYPFVVHLSGVFSHCLNACLFYAVLVAFKVNRATALCTACIFLASPLTVLATGWSAALMDRWYIGFGLLALLGAVKTIENKNHWWLIGVFLGSCGAILSKETAMILPGLLLVFIFIKGFEVLKSKYIWLVGLVWFIPIAAFLAVRLPAIMNSFSGSDYGAHSASLDNVLTNIWVYFAYPFNFELLSVEAWVHKKSSQINQFFFVHGLLLLLVGLRFGFRFIVFYIAGYFLFLLPVLPIGSQGEHYLYGSALLLSLALGFMWKHGYRWQKPIIVILILLSLVHTFKTQQQVYRIGVCQSRIDASLQALYLSSSKPEKIYFSTQAGMEYVLKRYIAYRGRVGEYVNLDFVYSPVSIQEDGALSLSMNEDCYLEVVDAASGTMLP